MDRTEYEARLRALDQRLESSIEVLRAAHRVERRALDYLWMTSPGNTEAGVAPAAFLPGPAAAPPSPESVTPAPAPALPPAKPAHRPRRWRSADLIDRLLDLVEEMPGDFSRDDILERLADNPPERSMLYRVLQEMVQGKILLVVDKGGGSNPVRYRRVQEGVAPETLEDGVSAV